MPLALGEGHFVIYDIIADKYITNIYYIENNGNLCYNETH